MRKAKKFVPAPLRSQLVNVKKKVNRIYNRYNERLYLDKFVGAHEDRQLSLNSAIEDIKAEISGQIPEYISFLIGTSHNGLVLVDKGVIRKILGGEGYYGITKNGGTWFAFHKTGLHGRIISFNLTNGTAQNLQVRIWGLSRGIHQIDFVDDQLFVIDTYNNRVLIYDFASLTGSLYWRDYTAVYYPNGKLEQGRQSKNYNHFNSIYRRGEFLYLVAHNETYKTGRLSELYKLTRQFEVTDIKPVNGSNCHNYYKDSRLDLICASMEGTVQNHGVDVLDVGKFTRGISIANDYFIFGGSDLQPDRSKRSQSSGYVYITDSEFELITTICIANTQIQEIRRVDSPELTLSNVEQEYASEAT